MIIFKKIIVLIIIMSSVLSKCLLPVKTGNWTLLTPFVYPGTNYQEFIHKKYENFSIRTKTSEECRNLTNDIIVMDREFLNQLYPSKKAPTNFFLQNYVTVFTKANFSKGHYYDQLAKRHLSWDTNLKFLVNINVFEAEESDLIGPMTKFVTLRMKNGVNFSLQLVENKTDFWTTNEPFLLLSNNSRSCISFTAPYLLSEIFSNKTNSFSCDDSIIASSTDLLEKVMISVIIIVIIIVVSIVCTCVLKRFCSKKRKQTMGIYHAWYQCRKQKTCEDNDSGYMEVVEIVESPEQPVYDYAYSTFKHLQLLDTEKNRIPDVIYEQIS